AGLPWPGPALPAVGAAPARAGWPRWLSVLVNFLAVLLVLASLGYLTWAVLLGYAIRRRSRWLGAAAAGYFALTMAVIVAVGPDPVDAEPVGLDDALVSAQVVVAWLIGAVHVLLLNRLLRGPGHRRRDDSEDAERSARRVLRERARYLLYHYPTARTELRIGRPDLPRDYDDGGLIDINAVPEEVIHRLPGLPADQCRQIAVVRRLRGGFLSMEDLAAHCLLPPVSTEPLREFLIFLPRPPAAQPPPVGQPVPDGQAPPGEPTGWPAPVTGIVEG
ncbi:transcriptional regulator, partial [Micromonospora zhanjiangensis]